MNGPKPTEAIEAAAWVWTHEREATACRLYLEQGFTASETARALGAVSRGAVIGKIKRLGFSKRQPLAQATDTHEPRRDDWATTARRQRLRTRSWPPQPLPLLKEAPLQGAPATLVQLGDAACRWPIDDPGPARMHAVLFCAAPATGGVYCAAHRALAAATPRQDGQAPAGKTGFVA